MNKTTLIEDFILNSALHFSSKMKFDVAYPATVEGLSLCGGGDSYFVDGKPSDLGRPLNINLIGDADYCSVTGNIGINKYRQLQPSEIRGCATFGKYAYEHVLSLFSKNTHYVDRKIYISNDFEHWKIIGKNGRLLTKDSFDDPSVTPSLIENARVLFGSTIALQVLRDMSWTIRFHLDNQHGAFGLFLNLCDLPELLAARELPDGALRRDAVIHFVRAHKRKESSGDYSDVCRYLRGTTTHLWNGCMMTILPPFSEVTQIHKSNKVKQTIEQF